MNPFGDIADTHGTTDCKHHAELKHRMEQIARLTHANECLKAELKKRDGQIRRRDNTIRKLKDPLIGAMTVAREKAHDS